MKPIAQLPEPAICKLTELRKSRLFLLLVAVVSQFFLAGCSKTSQALRPSYQYKSETRQNFVELRATLKPEDISNIGLKNGWGIIESMADEGSVAASGSVVVSIDMENLRNRMRRSESNLASQLDRMRNLEKVSPSEIAALDKALKEKELEYSRAEHEARWLWQRKNEDEIWKIHSDLQIASISFAHASRQYDLKKQIAEKGFDSAFSLKTSEIDRRSREIELDYARRIRDNLSEPPLPEDLARVEYQKSVASGEIWLASNQLESASLSAQIKVNNLEVTLERIRASLREETRSMEESELKAPRSGIVIHPVLWGDFKFRPGQQAWSGVTIMQIIGDDGYYLEALANEAEANVIVEKASASVEFDSLPGRTFSAAVKSISKAPRRVRGQQNSAIRFFPVQIALDSNEKLLIGGKGTARIILGEKTGVFLPRDLLIVEGEKTSVKVPGRFGESRREIEVEEFNQDWVLWKNPPDQQGELLFP
ncbi:MAG: HlyD family efflux transporter periplasmic adaptor subunit [Candidatus Riflebacteria bacterium]|nr:HlyD family efflux transporter periplasmic adaptor subunit [Candidatus Riflebacteria bacterium]